MDFENPLTPDVTESEGPMKEIHKYAAIGFEYIMDIACDCMWGLCCFCFLPVTIPLALIGRLVAPKSPTHYRDTR